MRRRRNIRPELDLHGVRHGDVTRSVIEFIESLWGSDQEVEIITGNSPRMIEFVTGVLDEYGLEYKVGGFLGLRRGIITLVVH